jgi:hypothetical protein
MSRKRLSRQLPCPLERFDAIEHEQGASQSDQLNEGGAFGPRISAFDRIELFRTYRIWGVLIAGEPPPDREFLRLAALVQRGFQS